MDPTPDPNPPPEPPTIPPEATAAINNDDIQSLKKAQASLESLSTILSTPLPSSLSSSKNPAFFLLHDSATAAEISSLLRRPDSGAGDDPLCRWLYNTFQSADPNLQLVVLRFIPMVAGVYLSRMASRKPRAGFEAVLLALYVHETAARNGQAITISIPDLSHPSIYHDSKPATKNSATEINIAVVSASLEPHGSMRSTRRARIVGVALELYYSKISMIPVESKTDFCHFCTVWAGQDGDMYKDGLDPQMGKADEPEKLKNEGEAVEEESKESSKEEREEANKEGRIPLPWELLQPVLRILGHCLMGPDNDDQRLHDAACTACRSLYARAVHDVSPKAILAIGSLLRLAKMAAKAKEDDFDPTDLPNDSVITG
ncbi:hypothetical protein NMG60_11017651 [Bertholletia excelsa]